MQGLLDPDFILSEEETENLFTDDNEEQKSIQEQVPPDESKEPNNKENKTTEEQPIDVENLFDLNPESVGSKGNKEETKSKDKENTTPTEGADISPNTNFYSSYAQALKVDGIFQNLSDEDIQDISDAETFEDAIERELNARFDEKQRRINEALQARVQPSVIGQYENVIKYLDSIDEDAISEEGEKGESIRTNLIYQDYLNRGFSKERAQREVKRALDNGTDIDDAKEALESNKEFFLNKYKALIEDAKAEDAKEKALQKKQQEELKRSILEEPKFGDIEIDKATRQKVYDNIARPIYRDPQTGDYLTAIEKYEQENRVEFLKNFGYYYTLTDGFKNMDGLVKGKVKKGIRNGMKELEKTLRTAPKPVEGNLKYMGGSQETIPDSFLNGKFKLDI